MALWSGRFSEKTDELVARYTESISYDRRLYPFDIAGSKAHAEMLANQGIIPQEDAEAIIKGLKAAGFPEGQTRVVQTLEEATDLLRKIARPGDTVLFENDLPDNYSE